MGGSDDSIADLAATQPQLGRVRPHASVAAVSAPRNLQTPHKPIERRLWFHLGFAAASFVAFALITYHLGKDVGFDLLNYHYYNGFALFTGAWQRNLIPAQTQSFFNPEADVLTYWLITYCPPAVAGMVMGGLQGLNFWLVFTIASYAVRFPNKGRLSWLQWPLWLACAGLALYAPAVVAEFGTYMQDLFTAIFVSAGVALALASFRAQRHQAMLLSAVAGLLLGFAAGLKLTNVSYAVGAGLTLFPTSVSRRGIQRMLVSYTAMALGFAAGGGYWSWNLWVRYGNPFFLSFNRIFKSPYAQFVNVNDSRFFPHTLKEALLYPFYFRVNTPAFPLEITFQDYSIAVCYILVVIALGVGAYRLSAWMSRRSPVVSPLAAVPVRYGPYTNRYSDIQGQAGSRGDDVDDNEIRSIQSQSMLRFVAFYAVSYVLWEIVFANYRYLTPLVLLAPVLIAMLVLWLIREPRLALLISLTLFAGIALTSVHYDWGRTQDWGDTYFGEQVPILKDPSSSLILMNTAFIDSYLIPAFPQSVTVVRIESGDMQYYSPKFMAVMSHDVESFHGDTYLLTVKTPGMTSTSTMIAHANQNLAIYGLSVRPGSCRPLVATVSDAPAYFCSIQHIAGKR